MKRSFLDVNSHLHHPSLPSLRRVRLGVVKGQCLPFSATHCHLFPVKEGTWGGENRTKGSLCVPSHSWQRFRVQFGNREKELSMLVSIISSVLGLLMDGDISWVMDILISLVFFFLCFVCESGSRRKSNACPHFGFLQELPMS